MNNNLISPKYAGKNAYEIVDMLINEEMRCSVSENDINYFMPDGKIVLAILKEKYGAHYVEDIDSRYCGYYEFNNPHYVSKPYYSLFYYYFNTCNKKFEEFGYYEDFNDIIDEITRFGYDRNEVINFMTEHHNCFIGKDCIWMVEKTMKPCKP